MWIPLQQTPGDKRGYTDPLKDLPGVSGDSKSLEELKKKENELHPLPAPTKDNTPGFDLPPADLTPDKFEAWQPEYQAKYLQKNGTAIQIGKSPNTLDVILSVDKTKAIILNDLDKASIAKLSTDDKKVLKDTAYFKNTLATRLGLIADGGASVKDAISKSDFSYSGGLMTRAQQKMFTDEAQAVADRCIAQIIYSPTDAQTTVAAVVNRYNAARSYGKWGKTSDPPGKYLDGVLLYEINSSDNGESMKSAFASMIQNEEAIIESMKQGDELANSGLSGGKKNLSAPELIAFFQLQEQTSQSYQNITNTTLVNGVNETLKDYAVMQDLIQKVLQSFPADAKPGDVRDFRGEGADTDPKKNSNTAALKAKLTDKQWMVFSMFEKHAAVSPYPFNPAEELNNVERPRFDMIFPDGFNPAYLRGFTRDQLNSMATQLSSKVTQLQSGTQTAMDIISNLQQKLTQHFSQANSCLQQGQTIIGTIGQGFVGG